MLARRIIPCLDIHDGRTAKGRRFVDLRDAGDPLELALRYAGDGADELVLLDISATRQGRGTLLDLVRRLGRAIDIPFIVGGGIGSVEDVCRVLDAGADKISINSAAVADPELIAACAARVGSQSVVVAIDALRADDRDGRWRVATHGGARLTELDAVAWARYVVEAGAGELLVTSIDRDGTSDGYDIELLTRLSAATRVPLIASGGAGHAGHLAEAAAAGADGFLVASMLHFGRTTISRLKRELAGLNIPIRT